MIMFCGVGVEPCNNRDNSENKNHYIFANFKTWRLPQTVPVTVERKMLKKTQKLLMADRNSKETK